MSSEKPNALREEIRAEMLGRAIDPRENEPRLFISDAIAVALEMVREEREKADAALEEMTVSYAQAEAALAAHHKAMDEPYNPADDQSVNLQDLGAPEVKKA